VLTEFVEGYAQAPVPTSWDAAVFLAGPTPRDPAVPSWRPAAVDLLRERWVAGDGGRLVVFIPEFARGRPNGHEADWLGQVEWEDACLNASDAIAFWVPRDMTTLPGLTTNVEWGRWESSGKVVLGAPPGAPGTKYLRHYATKVGAPTADTLHATMDLALDLALTLAARRRPA
jgi:hypothetical protein